MYNSDYYSVNGGGLRFSRRKVFYIFLGLFLGTWLLFLLLRSGKGRSLSYSTGAATDSQRKKQPQTPNYREAEPLKPPNQAIVPLKESKAHEEENAVVEKRNLVPFEATKEWQNVPDNAVIPQGLEVRMNLQTGLREARLYPDHMPENVPVTKADSHQPQLSSNPVPPKLTRQVNAQATVIEGRLNDIVSLDVERQKASLDWLDEEAHNLAIGSAICHARNFNNLFILLESPQPSLRLPAAAILAAAVHNNQSATEAALSSELVAKLLERLRLETNPNITRRVIAILTYLAESDLPGTLHKIVSHNGFAVLDAVAAQNMSKPLFERFVVLLAALARDETLPLGDSALEIMERHISKASWLFDEVYQDDLRPVCKVETAKKPVRFPKVVAFCKDNVPHYLL